MEVKGFDVLPIQLNLENLTMGDPFLKRMLKIKASPVILGAAFAILLTIIRMIAAWCSGYLGTIRNTIGFFEDPGMYINLIAGIAVWTYYFWMPRGLTKVFTGLFESKAIGKSHSATTKKRGEDYTLSSFLSEMQLSFDNWIWSLSALVLTVGGSLMLLLPRYLSRMQIQDSWSLANPINLILSILWAITGLYAALLLFFFILLSIIWLRRLFTYFKVEVRPFILTMQGDYHPWESSP